MQNVYFNDQAREYVISRPNTPPPSDSAVFRTNVTKNPTDYSVQREFCGALRNIDAAAPPDARRHGIHSLIVNDKSLSGKQIPVAYARSTIEAMAKL